MDEPVEEFCAIKIEVKEEELLNTNEINKLELERNVNNKSSRRKKRKRKGENKSTKKKAKSISTNTTTATTFFKVETLNNDNDPSTSSSYLNEDLQSPFPVKIEKQESTDLSSDDDNDILDLQFRRDTKASKKKKPPTKKKEPSLSVHLQTSVKATNSSESDGESDLEIVAELSRRDTSGGKRKNPEPAVDVIISDNDELDPVSPSVAQNTRPKRLCKTSKPVCARDSESSDEEGGSKPKKENPSKKDKKDIFTLSENQLWKYIKDPEQIEDITNKWSIDLKKRRLLPDSRWELMKKFFKKCGSHVEQLTYFMTVDEITDDLPDFSADLGMILNYAKHATHFKCRYKNVTKSQKKGISGCSSTLKVLHKCIQAGNFQSLKYLTLLSTAVGSIRKEEFDILLKLDVKLLHLELGDSLWEDISPESFEEFLNKHKNTLESLVIKYGFEGHTNKEENRLSKSKFVIKFPKMENFKNLNICASYNYMSELQEPHLESARREGAKTKAHFRFGIEFTSDMPKLEKIILGNLVDIEELPFSILRRLKMFKCGSAWNLSAKFPPENSRQSLIPSLVTKLQLPDGLKDPSFIQQIAKYFPNLKKVWIKLPSVPVLRSFFKNMENSSIEELYLETQFDFESTLESCLLTDIEGALKKNNLTKRKLETLKRYKHFKRYVECNNIHLPLETIDLTEENSAGIQSLKFLKVLELNHIMRTLHLPDPEEEREWDDPNCKFLKMTIGFKEYPLSAECHLRILKMGLDYYKFGKNVKMPSKAVVKLAGYKDSKSDDENEIDSDDDLFVEITNQKKGVILNLQSSTLQPKVED